MTPLTRPSHSHAPVYPPLDDDRAVAAIRLVLAASALLIIVIDPTEPNRYADATHAALLGYTLYSLLLVLAAYRGRAPLPGRLPGRLVHWVDIAWYTLLVALSHGTSSIFF